MRVVRVDHGTAGDLRRRVDEIARPLVGVREVVLRIPVEAVAMAAGSTMPTRAEPVMGAMVTSVEAVTEAMTDSMSLPVVSAVRAGRTRPVVSLTGRPGSCTGVSTGAVGAVDRLHETPVLATVGGAPIGSRRPVMVAVGVRDRTGVLLQVMAVVLLVRSLLDRGRFGALPAYNRRHGAATGCGEEPGSAECPAESTSPCHLVHPPDNRFVTGCDPWAWA